MVINRWTILAVLVIGRLSVANQFQSTGSVAPFLIEDLRVGYDRIGTLIGIYMIPGLLLAIPAGHLGKRFGDRQVVSAAVLLMIVGGILSGMANSYALLIAGRLVGGTGAAFLFVLLMKMLSDWFADKELFFGMSIFIIGWPVGIGAAQAVQGHIAEFASWNLVFYLTAAASAVALVTIAGLYRAPSGRDGAPAQQASSGLSGKEIWLVCIAGCAWMLINGVYLVILSFGPVLLIEQGASVTGSARIVSLMSWVFLFALPLGGYVATRYRIPDLVLVSGVGVCVVIGALIPYTSVPAVTFALFSIAYAIAVPVVSSLPALVLKPENRGPGPGIFQLRYFAGSAFLPIAAGFIQDRTRGATAPIFFATGMMVAVLPRPPATSQHCAIAFRRRFAQPCRPSVPPQQARRQTMHEDSLSGLSVPGTLRVGINLGNILLVTGSTPGGDPVGVAPDMAAAIAERLGVAVSYVTFATPGEVADAVERDEWDIGLIAVEPKRAEKIAFSDAYVEIEATYLVPANSPLQSIEDVDRPGVRIAVSDRAAYDLYLSRTLKHAELHRAKGLAGAFELFKAEKLDALAGLVPALRENAESLPGSRVLDGRYTSVLQAIGTKPENVALHAFVQQFIAETRESGLVARLLEKHGVNGKLQVAAG